MKGGNAGMDSLPELDFRRGSFCNGASTCVEVAIRPDGSRAIRDSKLHDSPVLNFTAEEWESFTKAVRASEF